MRNEDLLSSSPPWWIDIYLYSPLWSPCPPNVPLSLPFNSVPEMRNSIEKILNRNFLLNKFHSNSTTTQPTAKKNNCQKWAPGIHPHKPHNSFLLQYKPHHQVCLDLLFDTVDSENLLGPVLTLLLQFAHTMPPPPYLLLCFPGLAASYIGGTVLDSTWNMKYASGTSWSPLRYGCLGNFTASSSHHWGEISKGRPSLLADWSSGAGHCHLQYFSSPTHLARGNFGHVCPFCFNVLRSYWRVFTLLLGGFYSIHDLIEFDDCWFACSSLNATKDKL